MKNTEQIIEELETRINNLEDYLKTIRSNSIAPNPPAFSNEEIKCYNYLAEMQDLLNWIKE